jgi:uncharacterized protein YaiE (UPF0345 family)
VAIAFTTKANGSKGHYFSILRGDYAFHTERRYNMKAVTGYVEIKSEDACEIVEFVRTHINDLKGKRLEIIGSETGPYRAEVSSATEPS